MRYILFAPVFLLITVVSVLVHAVPQTQTCNVGSANYCTDFGTNVLSTNTVSLTATQAPVSTATITKTTSTSATTIVVMFDLARIPMCASNCAISAMGATRCPRTDYKCICGNSAFTENLVPCVEEYCSKADQQAMFNLTMDLCAVNSVPIVITPGTATSTTPTATPATSTSTRKTTSSTSTRSTLSTTTSSSVTSASTSTSTAGAIKILGSGFAAAVMGAALFVL